VKRRNLDLNTCTVRVETTVVELNGSTLLLDQPPKSEAGRRVVSFPAYLRPVLEAHMKAYTGEGADSYVFTSPKGAVLRRSNFRPVWIKALADAGLVGVRVHDLRHTGAAIAAQTGATLKELMNRIGHSTARAAINYQHAADGRDQEIASALDKLIKKEQGKRRAAKRRPSGKRREG
jgi:integrase